MLSLIAYPFKQHFFKTSLFSIWLVLLISLPDTIEITLSYFGFLFLGVIGAIFANSTGAGGGVVFVPFFNQLSLSSDTIVATSFAIQCCGMTAGAITWFRHFRECEQHNHAWQELPLGLFLTIPLSVLGILVAQFGLGQYMGVMQDSLHLGFGIFSILLAFALYASIPLMKKQRQGQAFKFQWFDILALMLIAFVGGAITAWLSVGVGELVAVYLILRGANITFAIALAVILSAFSVWGGIGYHLWVSHAIYWEVLIFAGAGAVIGGILAKQLVVRFSVVKLKIFFASWVLIMGLAGLPIFG